MDLTKLKPIHLFSDFTELELSKIASVAEPKFYSQGSEIFTLGEEASAFYVVLMGTVKLVVVSGSGDEVLIRTLGSGSHFGEMPFIDGQKRSASVQTLENCDLLEFKYSKFENLLMSDASLAIKFYRSAAKYLALRLRATNLDLNQLKELKFHH